MKGDNFGVNRVDVLRQFPYPENFGRFVPPSLIWNRISERYSTRYVNKMWAYKEYQPGGMSDLKFELHCRYPLGSRVRAKEYVCTKHRCVGLLDRAKAFIQYVRFSFHGNIPLGQQ